ncbi:MAG: hypothetical protein KDK37_12270, partial [Leptospiraceae bacterium]|nr:hypothetical protein [Leptospiraceae bacterium]
NYRNGYGISHIIARREAVGHDSAHFIKHLPDTIREGEVFRKKEKDETVFIRHPEGSKEILIRLNWFGERKVWLLTGYFTEPEVGGKALKSRIGILQGYPGSMDAAPDLPVYKNIGNSPPSQDRLDVRKARGFPIMCDYCKDWSTHNPILRVFASYEEFARSPYYGGGDHVINDPYAEFATWPGKTNANRHFEDWWVCVPVHPNCSHGYQPYDPEESEYDFSDTFSKVEEEIRDEQDRAAETRKSAFYSIGVFQAATCACCDPSIHRPEVSWTREYLSRSNLINRGEK